jgi:peptidyl-prolyl cis-trans isomerase D
MDISEIQDFGNGYYLIQVTERKEPEIPLLAQVFERVKADTIQARQDEQAKGDAEKCLAEMKGGAEFASAAAEFELTVAETGFFKRNAAIPQIGYEPTLSQSAFMLHSDQVLPDQAFKGGQGWYVIQFKERKRPDGDGFEKEKSELTSRLLQQKKQATFQQWLSDLRANGRIDIQRDVIQ